MSLRREIVTVAREMRARGLVTSTVGNVSARHGEGMLITPTRQDYAELSPRRLVALGFDGRPLGRRGGHPSREWRLHAAVYRARPEVGAIVHTHSPYATARSFDPTTLVVETEERGYLGLDQIAVAEWGPPGTVELAHTVTKALGGRSAVLLARHGVIAVGATPRAALELSSTVEHQALIERVLRERARGPQLGPRRSPQRRPEASGGLEGASSSGHAAPLELLA
jgi:L-fuculose-phosphate aldolase